MDAAQFCRQSALIARPVCADQTQYDVDAYVMWFREIHVKYMLIINIGIQNFGWYDNDPEASHSSRPSLGSSPDGAPFGIGDTIVQ